MRQMWVFTVQLTGMANGSSERVVEAHYLTPPVSVRFPEPVKFWIKEHWYSRRRCVGAFDWQFVVGVQNEKKETNDWWKEAKIQISTGERT